MNRLRGHKAYKVVKMAMALERLQARAAAGVLDLDGAVLRRRRQLGRVVREQQSISDSVSTVMASAARGALRLLGFSLAASSLQPGGFDKHTCAYSPHQPRRSFSFDLQLARES
jgi:hypothetical protein